MRQNPKSFGSSLLVPVPLTNAKDYIPHLRFAKLLLQVLIVTVSTEQHWFIFLLCQILGNFFAEKRLSKLWEWDKGKLKLARRLRAGTL
jgi:hypothetical protein